MQKVKGLLLLLLLVFASWNDWKTRSISHRFLLLTGLLGGFISFVMRRSIAQISLSCGVGFLLLGLSYLTRGGIGAGDAWFFIVLGLYFDWQESMYIFLSGLLICFGVSLVVIVWKNRMRNGRHMSFPFLPFLLPGGIFVILSGLLNG